MPPAIEETGAREGPSERQQRKRGCVDSTQINRKAGKDCLETFFILKDLSNKVCVSTFFVPPCPSVCVCALVRE